jgi:DNA primase
MNEYTKEQLQVIFQANGIDLLARGTGDISIDCPFCGNEKKKCWVKGNVFHCFRCEERGSVKGLFRQLNIVPGEVSLSTEDLKRKMIRARNAMMSGGVSRLNRKLERTKLPQGYRRIERSNKSEICRIAYKFLKKRGMDWKDAERWEIGYGETGEYVQHLIFPVLDHRRMFVTFQARRFLGNFDPKTKNPYDDGTTYSKTDALYGAQFMRKGNSAVLVEGPFDAIYLNKIFGLLNLKFKALAVLGHKLSPIQIQYLSMLRPSSVYVMFDSDVKRESKEAAAELASWLEAPVYLTLLENGDPDDLEPEEALEKISRSKKIPPGLAKSRRGRFGARQDGPAAYLEQLL